MSGRGPINNPGMKFRPKCERMFDDDERLLTAPKDQPSVSPTQPSTVARTTPRPSAFPTEHEQGTEQGRLVRGEENAHLILTILTGHGYFADLVPDAAE